MAAEPLAVWICISSTPFIDIMSVAGKISAPNIDWVGILFYEICTWPTATLKQER